ncbi:REP element-mobilizing transposase RayT [Bacillus pakistanensis]|uniref:REP element-mobilizing transposase RayT n=1 Tax=Rossellomorea pakistanensis TaxID=992288 RepID=A0ABS2ND42_9BACI|nr:transposase [Bacillus pakistanensis]MBM7585730.1 REP element-mobilizing transposase RayT [Bacillus pakistanensis]
MGRKRRVWSPDHFYHISARGNRRDLLFQDEKDFQAFSHILTSLYETTLFETASYCFMTNHYHIQIRSPYTPISQLMAHINKKYATYFNSRYNLTGHVFENRYYGEPIKGMTGHLKVSRYIHLNPVEANIVKDPSLYRWSSYPTLLSPNPHYNETPYFNPDLLLNIFQGTKLEKQSKYSRLVEKENSKSWHLLI